MNPMRLMRTVRHLRAEQIAGQVRVRLQRRFENAAAFAEQPAPVWPGVKWQPRVPFIAPAPPSNPQARVVGGELGFLNQTRKVGWPPDWNRRDPPLLWQYNLHYFEYLWELDYEQAREAARDWIRVHKLGRGQTGWEPYPVSLRLENWCAVFFARFRARTESDSEWRDELWQSIWLQAQWLLEHPETHLLGNHLLENGIALALMGACFGGEAARRWRDAGLRILRREIGEQVLADGAHFERSPMYQLRVAYALALLANGGDAELRELVDEPLEAMARALEKLRHPDGEIALFNDSALGVYRAPAEVIAFAEQASGRNRGADKTAGGAFALAEAGYYGTRVPAERGKHYLLCDAGPIGPDYIPGHAHGDIFSFELSLDGRRVIVDAGVFDYEASSMRAYCRSTAAHNTVEIDGRDQCELWQAFRVGRRGRPHDVSWKLDENGFRLSGWHDGYRWLKERPVHRREFSWHDAGVLMVRDTIEADGPVSGVCRLHLHPDCEVLKIESRMVTVGYPAGRMTIAFAGVGELDEQDAFYCPGFGRRLDNRALVLSFSGSRVQTGFCISSEPFESFDLELGARIRDRIIAW